MSFQKKLLKNVFSYGSFTYSSYLISFLSFTILSRLLTPAEYGFVALITVFTGFVSIFSDAGISLAVIRSDYGVTFHKALNNLTYFMGGALFLIVCLLAWPIAWFYNNDNLIIPTLVFALIFLFKSLSIIPQAILNKSLQFAYLGRSQLIVNVSSSLLSIAMAWLGFSYWAIIIPQIAGALLLYILLNYRVQLPLRLYPKKYTLAAFEKAKWLIKNILGFNLINYWARNADNLIIGKFYTNTDLGIYSKSYSLLTLPLSMITVLFSTVLLPSLKQLVKQGGDTKKEYKNVLGIISLINWPVAMVLIFLAYPLVDFLWGAEWIAAAEFLPYFGLLVLSQTLISTTGSYFILINKERVMLWTGVASAFLMVMSIGIGALFSVLDIARFYALGYLVLMVPIFVYFGFVRTFGFNWHFVLTFWVPKVVLSLLILAALWMGYMLFVFVLMTVYLAHLLYLQRNEISIAMAIAKRKVFNR